MKLRVTSAQLCLTAVCLAFGVLLMVQFRTQGKIAKTLLAESSADQAQIVSNLYDANVALRKEVGALEVQLRQQRADHGAERASELASDLQKFRVINGTAPAFGPGLPPPRGWRTRLLSRAVALATDLMASRLRRRVNGIRASYGLPALDRSVSAWTGRLPLYLIPSVRELDYQRRDLPPNVHYVGPCIWHSGERVAVPAWLNELSSDRPWVHVTEGTLQQRDPFVLQAAAQGLADQPVAVILTTGPQRRPDALRPLHRQRPRGRAHRQRTARHVAAGQPARLHHRRRRLDRHTDPDAVRGALRVDGRAGDERRGAHAVDEPDR